MGAFQYLFSFKGRINRAKMWLFILVTIGWEIPVLIVMFAGLNWQPFSDSLSAELARTHGDHIDFSNVAWPPVDGTLSAIAMAVFVALVVLYVWASYAVFVKRLHDRNKSAWWLIPYSFVPMALDGFSYCTETASDLSVVIPLGTSASLISTLISLWVFIELFCLRGTHGENRFGIDPLGGPRYCTPDNPALDCIPKPAK